MNYAAQLMALIDIGRTIASWATKNDTTSELTRQKTKLENWVDPRDPSLRHRGHHF